MKEKYLPVSILDGGIRTLLLYVLSELSLSVFVTDLGLDIYAAPVIFSGVFALLSGVVSILRMRRFSRKRSLRRFWLCSLGWFLLGCVLLFVNLLTVKIRMFPIRPIGIGDAVYTAFASAFFFIGSECIRLISLAVLSLRRKSSDAP